MSEQKPRAVVYLAAPYSSDPEKNVRDACRTWDLLNNVYPDVLFFCPHWSHLQHEIAPLEHGAWLRYDLKILEVFRASGLPIAMHRAPGGSEGCDIEEAWAKANQVTLFVDDLDGLQEWLDEVTL